RRSRSPAMVTTASSSARSRSRESTTSLTRSSSSASSSSSWTRESGPNPSDGWSATHRSYALRPPATDAGTAGRTWLAAGGNAHEQDFRPAGGHPLASAGRWSPPLASRLRTSPGRQGGRHAYVAGQRRHDPGRRHGVGGHAL